MSNLENILGGAFIPSDVPKSEYELLPRGDYTVEISSVDLKENSKKTGYYLEFVFSVLGGQYDGRKTQAIINIKNESEKAQTIGQRQLADITDAVGFSAVRDTDVFLSKKLKISVDAQEGKGTYVDKFGQEKPSQAQNVIKKYFPLTQVANTKEKEEKKSLPWD